ncbi:hypothetical protein EB796_023668 [Bugula neritina]|uniref:CCHC-type domain-containing protein n=1 Tax=Bugula neritina TaxID=10212 RepID=A0A7J7IW36_BUGNE|nr:hypothetical protein EB796_023668 [Bugula neritina]
MDSVKLNSAPETVSAVRNGRVNSGARPKHTESNSKSQAICYRCSRTGHLAVSNSCPAKDKTCKDCGKRGHFAKSKFCKGTTKHHTVAKVEEMSKETLFAVKGKSEIRFG